MFMSALFTIAKRYPSTEEWIKKMCLTYNGVPFKQKKILTDDTYIGNKPVTKDKYSMIPLT